MKDIGQPGKLLGGTFGDTRAFEELGDFSKAQDGIVGVVNEVIKNLLRTRFMHVNLSLLMWSRWTQRTPGHRNTASALYDLDPRSANSRS